MKKRRSLLLATLLIIFAVVISGCSSSNNNSDSNKTVDESFKDDLMSGLSARWAIADDNDDTEESYQLCIDEELNRIAKYKNKKFEDSELGELAKAYIESVEYTEATLEFFDNYDKWTIEWEYARNDRTEALYKLNKKLELQFSSEYDQESFENLINEGKLISDINKLVDSIKFETTASEDGWNTYTAIVENTTDENFDSITFDIKLVDADGVTVETTDVYTENWSSGDKVKFEFETDTIFENIEIVSWEYYY